MSVSMPLSVKKQSSIVTKCDYCGRSYTHCATGPIVLIYECDFYAFTPKLETRMHDCRQPILCKGCGAEVYLKVT